MAPLATVPMQSRPVASKYYGIKEAVERLGCGERWLRDGINHGGFPHSRVGKFIIFDDADLAEIYRMFRVPARPARRGRKTA